MNSLEVVMGASLEELAEVSSGAREGQPQEGAAARRGAVHGAENDGCNQDRYPWC